MLGGRELRGWRCGGGLLPAQSWLPQGLEPVLAQVQAKPAGVGSVPGLVGWVGCLLLPGLPGRFGSGGRRSVRGGGA